MTQGSWRPTWSVIQDEITRPSPEGFLAAVEFVERRNLIGLDEQALERAYTRDYPARYRHPAILVVDHVTISSPEHPILIINLNSRETTPPSRAIPQQIQGVENNLTEVNTDYVEFARAVDPDGVFRGF